MTWVCSLLFGVAYGYIHDFACFGHSPCRCWACSRMVSRHGRYSLRCFYYVSLYSSDGSFARRILLFQSLFVSQGLEWLINIADLLPWFCFTIVESPRTTEFIDPLVSILFHQFFRRWSRTCMFLSFVLFRICSQHLHCSGVSMIVAALAGVTESSEHSGHSGQ